MSSSEKQCIIQCCIYAQLFLIRFCLAKNTRVTTMNTELQVMSTFNNPSWVFEMWLLAETTLEYPISHCETLMQLKKIIMLVLRLARTLDINIEGAAKAKVNWTKLTSLKILYRRGGKKRVSGGQEFINKFNERRIFILTRWYRLQQKVCCQDN